MLLMLSRALSSKPGAHQPELSIDNIVRLKREQLGLSCRKLGAEAGLSPAYVSALENGHLANPSLAAFSRLVVALRLSPSEVFLIVQNAALQEKDGED